MLSVTMVAVVVLVVTLLVTILLAKSKALGPLVTAAWVLGASAVGSLWVLLG